MKQFIEIPQGEEIVLINVNHISAIETVTFGEKQLCKIYVSRGLTVKDELYPGLNGLGS